MFLQCSTAEIVRRVGNADRVERGKMASGEGFRDSLASCKVSPVPPSNCLVVDSEIGSAEANARQITRHFDLAG